MANIFLDLASNAKVAALNTYGTAVSSTAALTAVDCVDVVGNMMSAMLTTSAVSGSGNVTIKLQESADNVTFTDITGATFTAVTAANDLQIISFKPVQRYVQAYGTLNSGTSVTCQVTLIAQKRVTPTNSGGWSNTTGVS